MLKNIDITEGLIFAENVSRALSSKIGKAAAHELVEKACKTAVSKKTHLKLILKKDIIVTQHLSENNLVELFKPENSIGFCSEMIDSILVQAINS